MPRLAPYSLGCCGIFPAISSEDRYDSTYSLDRAHHSAALLMFKVGDEIDKDLRQKQIKYDIVTQEGDYITAIVIYNPTKKLNEYSYKAKIK